MRAVFIVGLARSGTTLMVSLLDGHPQLFVLPHESHVLDWCDAEDPVGAMESGTKLGPMLPDDALARMRERIRGPAGVKAALETLVAACDPPSGATAWVEKTPRHLRAVPRLLKAFGPQTRVVALVRDPRAVLASQAAMFRHATGRPLRRFARRWATAVIEVDRLTKEHPEVLAVRYEDLVRDTEAQMRRVAGHLDLPWSDTLLAPSGRGPWTNNSSVGSGGDGVFAGSLERWREKLEPAEVEAVERLLAPRMAAWDYALEHGVAASSSWDRLLLDAAASWRASRDLSEAERSLL